ncbi:hypothetical protein MtrunA17_Chr6g0458761 [Medicago truncatula]|uniref:Uncharacterized protein n=1 Tax=Medicago truncatula TaxID=3880 RepID=A0A396HB97_MEDTR|nr:pescadillo homolog [Medicago truncatula]XP_039682764.1 pescadillo homolog [Medicago truncatula]XP_039682765.1 pescadillo homolog [Medicago truncatula]XP_039690927.1 pescadillo homolog [Medicago truncatula]RHN50559.1 hypothetical protein MtrunA17_Chr6g0458761 [Medicago truncatula]
MVNLFGALPASKSKKIDVDLVHKIRRTPPPHLSPFVNYDEEGYISDNAKTINHLQSAATEEFLPLPGVGKDDSLQGAITYISADSNVEKEISSSVVQTEESTTNGQENVDTDMSLLVMSRKNIKIFEAMRYLISASRMRLITSTAENEIR